MAPPPTPTSLSASKTKIGFSTHSIDGENVIHSPASKTKIGFSIDSIIGEDVIRSPNRSYANQLFNLHAGPIRPLPIVPQNLIESETIPPYINLPNSSLVYNLQYIQPQFQMAAANAPRQAERNFSASSKIGSHPQHPNMGSESYPLSWSLTRHGRIFPHRRPGNFRQHPITRPKQVRKVFSPSELLKLEYAFESNQRMVGPDRKALAQALNVSETHVTIWFQNRRAKLKKISQKKEENEIIDIEGFSEDDGDS